ncbi:sensor histidine kinase [Ferruginibacter sp. SUN106]|uniref:sensor histidine kinase n=1 Tax=Ferruginibacter sp. SUN106 TaxID=2978348 RepID=UPI003D35F9A2
MRYVATAIFLLFAFFIKAQDNFPGNKLPVFKQVTHPFMPPITSEYFFFSQDGLMWFSTGRGLTSFDGSDIIYHPSLPQANGFGLSRISAMAEDKQHNFYIGTPTGFYYYNRLAKSYTSFTYTYLDNNQLFNPGTNALYLDNNGIVYAGSGLGGLLIYDPYKNILSHYNLDATKPDSWQDNRLNSVISFAAHATDTAKLWVGTYNGIYLLDKINKTFSRNFDIVTDITHKYNPNFTTNKNEIDVQRMDVANDSIIWFNSWSGGFVKYNSQTGKAAIVFGRDAVYKSGNVYYGYIIPEFVKLTTGKYLIGIYNGKTALFDTKTNGVIYFNASGVNYPEDETRYTTTDQHNNIWLLQKGILYVSVPEKFRLQTVDVPNLTQYNFHTPKIRGMYFDSSSDFFNAAFLGSTGIHVYDTNFIQQAVLNTSLINNFYNYGSCIDNKVTKDGSGRLWTAGWKVHVLQPGEKFFTKVEKKIPALAWLGAEDRFTDIATTRTGNILIKKTDGVIYLINHFTLAVDTIRCPAIKADGVEIKSASAWYDNERDLLYLTSKEGVAQFNLDKKRMRIIPYSSLFGGLPSHQGVCAPALDAAGRLWLMTTKYGMRIIDPVSLSCVDSMPYGSRGLIRGDYTAIIGASGHYILLRSQNGIVVYDYLKQQSFLFDHSNGLSSPDNKSFLYCHGYMFIGQSSRFEYFKLSNLDDYSSIVAAYLNTITVDTATVFIRTGFQDQQNIKLSHEQNTLTFSFSAPEFFFPERIEYAYQLLPVDKEWHYTNYFNRKIIYTKLDPGKYRFLLKAQLQGGSWDVKPVEYIIAIVPAWWQTIFFKAACGVLLFGLFFYFNRRRIKGIRKKEQQTRVHEKALMELEAKALRAQMNPHFIFNCLNSIKSLIQQHEEEKSVMYLTTFSKLIRTLFNNADKKDISLFDEIETCRYYLQLEAMRFDTQFSYAVHIDEDIDLKSIQVPALIIQPFIENAIWHGIVPHNNGGHVSLQVIKKETFIEVIIDDDGIGRASSLQNKSASGIAHQSKGVNLTQSRLELNNLLQQRQAQLYIIDKKNEHNTAVGTTVIITIKEELT